MSTTDASAAYIRLVRDVFRVSSAVGTRSYVWGGLVVDVLQGELLRVHHDLDCFTLDLLEHQPTMAHGFRSLGYEITTMEEFQILRVDRDGVHAAFNPLTLHGDSAVWHHVGRHGRIEFPVAWLDSCPRRFHGTSVYTSGPRFELAIKLHPELLNPEWRVRPKDRAAICQLQVALENAGCSDLDFLGEIVSDTPFWVERGYPEYAQPIRVPR